MSNITTTPQELTLYLVNSGATSGGGWVPGNGYPTNDIGRVGQRFIDVQTGRIYGPKTRSGWPAEYTHTLNLGNVTGEFSNLFSRIPSMEAAIAGNRTTIASVKLQVDSFATQISGFNTSISGLRSDVNDLGTRLTALTTRFNALSADYNSWKLVIEGSVTDLGNRITNAEGKITNIETWQNNVNNSITNINNKVTTGFQNLTSELGDAKASVTNLSRVVTTNHSAYAEQITTLTAEFADNSAMVQQKFTAYADKFSAQATANLTLQASVGEAKAMVQQESLARANQYSALAQNVTNLDATYGGSIATLTSQQTALATEQLAQSEAILNLSSVVGPGSSEITEKLQTLTTANTALAQRISTMEVSVGTVSGRITEERTARINGDSAVLSDIQGMELVTGSQLRAAIDQEATIRREGDATEARLRSNLNLEVGNIRGSIQSLQTVVNNGLSTQSTKTDTLRSDIFDGPNSLKATFDNQIQTMAGPNGAIANQVKALKAEIIGPTGTLESTLKQLIETKTDSNSTLARSITNLQSKLGDTSKLGQFTVGSNLVDALSTEASKIRNAEGKITGLETSAVKTTELKSSVEGILVDPNGILLRNLPLVIDASVKENTKTVARTDGYASAQWSLIAQATSGGRKAIAGMRTLATIDPSTKEEISEIALLASRVLILNEMGQGAAPFTVEGNIVRMQNASVGTMQIEGGSVTTMAFGSGAGSASCALALPAGATGVVVSGSVSLTNYERETWIGVFVILYANGSEIARTYVSCVRNISMNASLSGYHSNPGEGAHTYTVACVVDPAYPGNPSYRTASVTATGGKR